MSTHRHRADPALTETKPFSGCICGIECKPASHGNVVYIEHCQCGASKPTNVNGAHSETSGWEPAEVRR